MSLGKIAARPGAARYYTDQVARGREDYYAGQKEEPGNWIGSGAEGFDGEVDADAFASLLGGAGLRRPPKSGGVAGIDLTFRAPKSVSVLWAVAPEELGEQLRAAHDAAVREAFGYLEREACWGRRGAGGKLQVPGGGFLGAAFMHRASRAGDPLLHTHVVIGNLTQGPDGRWTALDARHLYRHAKTAGYLYQAVLRAEITDRIGLGWTPVDRGVADLTVVPREVIDHFSQRRHEILEHMVEHGGRSAASAQIAALETRRAKDEPPLARQRAQWRARAAEHGLGPDKLADLTAQPRPPTPTALTGIDPEQLTEHASTFGRPDVLQALARAQPTGARLADLERLADQTLNAAQVVRLRDGTAQAGITEHRFSTQELLAAETHLLELAAARRHTNAAVVSDHAIDRALAARPTLSDEQRDVARRLTTDGDGITVLRAAAGTGKTFVLDAAREAWQEGRREVHGCALSARAARELEDQSAIPSHTIASLKRGLAEGRELPLRSVLVVDEAGMVGTRDLALLADAASRSFAKLVLVGDDHQLPEIDAGGAFRALAEQGDALELREVRRQRQPWDRQALDALRGGDVERWARAYRKAGRITVGRGAADTRAALVNDWARADGERLMIAGRRADVRDLNQRARALRRASGDLGPDELTAGGRGFATGDHVLATRNDHRLGVLNGQRGTITAIDPEQRTITLTTGDREHTLDDTYLAAGHLDHGYATTAHRAQGATVDRTFVLGSEELYREWGYTALSRHRHEARFYVARTDLDLHADRAPAPDDVVAGLGLLLGRSRAKELARAGLPELDDDVLATRHAQLEERLREDPPPLRTHRLRALELAATRAREDLDRTQERRARLEETLDQTPIWRRRERAATRDALARTADVLTTNEARWVDGHATQEEALRRTDAWLTRNEPALAQYVQTTNEQLRRGSADAHARARLERLDPHEHPFPGAPHPGLDRPGPDHGLDLGW